MNKHQANSALSTPIETKLTDHSYDGIQEYDNPTPGWWHLIFFVSIAFSLLYFPFYHMGGLGRSVHDKYEVEVAKHYERLFADVGELKPDQETILRVMHDPELARFQPVAVSIFVSKCAACHGALGQGGTGPNMTDDAYKNIKSLTDIANVIANGAANNAMPAWKDRLHPNQVTLLAGYVASLRGKAIPGRQAEGEVPSPWPQWKETQN